MKEALTNEKQLPVTPEVAAYNEAWRVLKALQKRSFEPIAEGADPKYLENRLHLAFEHGWNECARYFESRTIKQLQQAHLPALENVK
jgi:hypothetical protein